MEQLKDRSSLKRRPSTRIPSGEKSSNLDIGGSGSGASCKYLCWEEAQEGPAPAGATWCRKKTPG